MVKKPTKATTKKPAKPVKAKSAAGKNGKKVAPKKGKPAAKPVKKAKPVVKAKATPKKAVAKKVVAKKVVAKKVVAKKVIAKPAPKKVVAKPVVKTKPVPPAKPVVPAKPIASVKEAPVVEKPKTQVVTKPVAEAAKPVKVQEPAPVPPMEVKVVKPEPKPEIKPEVKREPEKKPVDMTKLLNSKPLKGRNFIDEILSPVGHTGNDKDTNVKPEMQKELSEQTKTRGNDDKRVITVEDKLRALYDLQLIDTRIDKIRAVRGELPLEVQDLEDEVAGLSTRVVNYREELENIDREIGGKKNAIKDAESLIKKYKEQQGKVRNNREFDSLTKETEYQELEIQLHKKKIKELEAQKAAKTELIEAAETKMAERTNDLKVKKTELDEIVAETEKEEKFLLKKSAEAQEVIENRLLDAYTRIREASRNGLAVVPIEREASAGSFITIPPQKQLDVAARKKIIIDEHSGRILVDAELAREETDRIEGLLAQELAR